MAVHSFICFDFINFTRLQHQQSNDRHLFSMALKHLPHTDYHLSLAARCHVLMITSIFWLLVLLFFCSCSNSNSNSNDQTIVFKSDDRKNEDLQHSEIVQKPDTIRVDSTEINATLRLGLVDVQSLNNKILVDLKYTGTNNFTREQLYYKIKRAYLQKEVADKLCKAQTILDEIKPGYHLLVYDAIRPREVQQKMWKALDSIPASVRINFVSNPRKGSIHNYGAAVDVTITNEKFEALDMGAEYDDSRKIAYPIYEKRFLNTGELLLEHIDNRKLLRLVMSKAGFTGIDSEWWHFNACSHHYAHQHYPIIEEEEDVFK